MGVIGAGNWGTTVASLIATAGFQVLLWARNSSLVQEINEQRTNKKYTPHLKLLPSIHATGEIKEVSDHCEVIFVIVPSHSFREVSHALGNYVGGDQILVSGTKGIENQTFRLMTEILKEETCCKKVGALSGPNIADEILRGQPSGAVIASEYNEVIDKVIEVLLQPLFKVYASKDVVGVETGGALKNIIAIASGIATGLGLETNSKAFLVTRGLVEVSRYGSFFGAQPQTFLGLSGMGDIVTTCFSMHSRNNTFGRMLAAGKKKEDILKEIKMVVEGVYTTESAYTIAHRFNIRMPITDGLYKILFENGNVNEVLKELMAVRMKFEDDNSSQPLNMYCKKYDTSF